MGQHALLLPPRCSAEWNFSLSSPILLSNDGEDSFWIYKAAVLYCAIKSCLKYNRAHQNRIIWNAATAEMQQQIESLHALKNLHLTLTRLLSGWISKLARSLLELKYYSFCAHTSYWAVVFKWKIGSWWDMSIQQILCFGFSIMVIGHESYLVRQLFLILDFKLIQDVCMLRGLGNLDEWLFL